MIFNNILGVSKMVAKKCTYSHYVDFHLVNSHKISCEIFVSVESDNEFSMSISDFEDFTVQFLKKHLIGETKVYPVSPSFVEMQLFDKKVFPLTFQNEKFEHCNFTFLTPNLYSDVLAVNFETVTHVTIR